MDETLARLEAERQVDVVTAPTPNPLQRDGRFWAGMALGAAALFTGATVTGPLKYLALLDIPAFGLAALVALKRVEDLQWAELAVRRDDRLGDRERLMREQFETDAQPVRNAMKILGVEQPHEIVLALEEHAKWASEGRPISRSGSRRRRLEPGIRRRVHPARRAPRRAGGAEREAGGEGQLRPGCARGGAGDGADARGAGPGSAAHRQPGRPRPAAGRRRVWTTSPRADERRGRSC